MLPSPNDILTSILRPHIRIARLLSGTSPACESGHSHHAETGATGGLHGGATYSAATRRYTIGAWGEWRFTNSFGFEVDAMYHRMGYVGIVNFFDSANGGFRDSAIDVRGNSWDFPMLAKYHFGHVVCPYVATDAGSGFFLFYNEDSRRVRMVLCESS